jgi:hypothetical protein
VRVDQLADNAEQAAFMQRAWGFVLGRLAEGIDVLLAAQPTSLAAEPTSLAADGPRRRPDTEQEDGRRTDGGAREHEVAG